MKKYYLILTCLIIPLVFSSCKSSENIVVKKTMGKILKDYDTVIVNAQNDNYKPSDGSRIGSGENTLRGMIWSALEKKGLKIIYNTKPSLIVECHYTHGWGLPRPMRHFKVSAKYVNFINIKFIDFLSKEVVGEVEYEKSFFQIDQKNIIENLINALLKEDQ